MYPPRRPACLQNILEGQAPSGAPVFADVRDVARAHILAVEVPEAKGRYIVSQAFTTPPHLISKWLQVRRLPGAGGRGGRCRQGPSEEPSPWLR